MKKTLLILLCLPMISFGQQTYVPDDIFEAYLESNGQGNGIPNDDYVTTANINTVTYLDVSGQNITDLTGIEAFTALTYLQCYYNQLTSLDVSQNTALTLLACYGNDLTSLDVSGATALNELHCENNQLTSLDVNNNIALGYFSCAYNQLTSLDVSNNIALGYFSCAHNQLTSLDARNGNNSNTFPFEVTNNPNLTCINVDNAVWSTANWTNIDSQHYFSNNCSGTTSIQEHTTSKELIKVTDLLVRETKGTKNELLFYIYDDGTVEKRIVIE
jgi:hypothetical protein